MTYSLLGIVIALALFLLSTSPSLLPRPWWTQAAISGVGMVAGYIAGFIIDWVARLVAEAIDLQISYDATLAAVVRGLIICGCVIIFCFGLLRNYRQAADTARRVKMTPPSPLQYFGALAGAWCVALILVGAYEGLYQLWRLVVDAATPLKLPEPVVALVSWAIVLTIVLATVEWGVIRQIVRRAARWASQRDRQNPPGVTAPKLPQRSASPLSGVCWETTSREGKRFLGGEAMAPRISAVTGHNAIEPIRIYTSLAAHNNNLAATVGEAITELRRTGAFSRDVLVVVVPTGSGWVDEWNIQAVEYLTGGNCATVAVQYSCLPSWMSFIRYRDQATAGGQLIVNAVRTEISRLAPQQRPQFFVTGESLGSFGAQAAFSSPAELLNTVDGALWIGTPGFTPLLRDLTAIRHRGSPQIAPVVDNARHIRFATTPQDLTTDLYGRDFGPWSYPRVIYLQHASDPVVWWNLDLAWKMPDWIGERAGSDVTKTLRWHRLVTCGQLLCDLPLAQSAPSGHGHSYHEELIPAWRALLGLAANENEDAAIAQAIAAHPV